MPRGTPLDFFEDLPAAGGEALVCEDGCRRRPGRMRSPRSSRRGRVRARFGSPLDLEGEDDAGLTRSVEEAVREL
jgi:hypothetical protein